MSVITKVLATGGILGAVGSGGYVATYLLSNNFTDKSIKNKEDDNSLGKSLRDKGHTLLDFDTSKTESDKATWNPILVAYSKSNKKLNGKTINVAGDAPTPENINDLKKECAKATASSDYNNDTLLITEQFCMRPISIKELAENNRATPLDADVTNENDSDKWDIKVDKYLETTEEKRITNVTLETKSETNQKANRDKLRAECKKFEIIKTHETDFHTKYEKYLAWCVV
ncbi:hypothetical protein A6V39_00010 [Candidatus Mycoplasma haematobovis]|uniref:Uncharacterized protein n=1 Tax=Candidatus Mycoplasma haematobovis TaxID=432608 RepID=A0A1A9QCX0_9MOLU|nr:hypothetical protein [Candidatus Mycoplasma haematobovis]OAL10432.1 hypothetical protein A6V39_00010 [Candidatus Mycoplasma haematobovis]